MAYKGWYAIKPKQPTNEPTSILYNVTNNTTNTSW